MAVVPMSSFNRTTYTNKKGNSNSPEQKFCGHLRTSLMFLDILNDIINKDKPKTENEFKQCHSNVIETMRKQLGKKSSKSISCYLFPLTFFDPNSQNVYVVLRLKYVKLGSRYVSSTDHNLLTKNKNDSCAGNIDDAINFYKTMLTQMDNTKSVGFSWYNEMKNKTNTFTSQPGVSPVSSASKVIYLPAPDEEVIDVDYEEE